MGSVVLEQLLRFAPDVARIYMLIRGKRGATGALLDMQAVHDISTSQLFLSELLNATVPNRFWQLLPNLKDYQCVSRGAAARQPFEEGSLL